MSDGEIMNDGEDTDTKVVALAREQAAREKVLSRKGRREQKRLQKKEKKEGASAASASRQEFARRQGANA